MKSGQILFSRILQKSVNPSTNKNHLKRKLDWKIKIKVITFHCHFLNYSKYLK